VSFDGVNIKVVDAVSKWFRHPLYENDDIEPTVYVIYHVKMYPYLSKASVSLKLNFKLFQTPEPIRKERRRKHVRKGG
jgi:hypothetical protein